MIAKAKKYHKIYKHLPATMLKCVPFCSTIEIEISLLKVQIYLLFHIFS